MRSINVLILILVIAYVSNAQWVKQTVNTTASLRGLSVVNDKVIWASGTGGTVIRTIDGGKTWDVMVVPNSQKLDFRDIEAFNANTAYILSIGSYTQSQIHRTTDGGKTWKTQFVNQSKVAFFDAIACWDVNNCISMSDPVGGSFLLVNTTDGGAKWNTLKPDKMDPVTLSESAFAASGTCLITHGKDGVFLVSGGGNARVFHSPDRGLNWTVVDTPIVRNRPGTGIFSIAMADALNGVIVGGDYEKPQDATKSLAFTRDGGKTWQPGTGLTGYRSAVTYLDRKTIIAVGTNGSDISRNGGKTWKKLGSEDLNAVQAKGKRAVWAVGTKGMVVKMK